MATEITDEDIANAALNPLEIEGQAGRVKNRSIDELIKARGVSAVSASGSGWASCRPTRVVPPGSIGPRSTED